MTRCLLHYDSRTSSFGRKSQSKTLPSRPSMQSYRSSWPYSNSPNHNENACQRHHPQPALPTPGAVVPQNDLSEDDDEMTESAAEPNPLRRQDLRTYSQTKSARTRQAHEDIIHPSPTGPAR
ncbi:hypothetical protein HPB48_022530 [Haemaphysalis longicornis]|uniref:Uncharacterized protein n=1 Tax=Haemaphysalis longicornis TaxID=44386 RepID=A0A9J6FSQ6_HAELO|nr:hypothetical protein HPB48_022530 [Haemaphysalis longicornis]